MSEKYIYLDNASTTPLDPRVWEVMRPYFEVHYGNPSSSHRWGAANKVALENARRTLSDLLHGDDGHLFFTSGGTESNNWALQGLLSSTPIGHIFTSPLEHKSVLVPLQHLAKSKQIPLTYLPIDRQGIVDLDYLEKKLQTAPHALVSLMHGNNEIGTLQDIATIGALCQKHGAIFHSDMVQTLGYEAIDLKHLHVDLAVGSAHKFHGPKGVGFLYVSPRLNLPPLLQGGMQEQGKRAGTENIAAIVGMAKALTLAQQEREERVKHIQSLQVQLYEALRTLWEDVTFYGAPCDSQKGLCHILSVGFPMKFSPETLFLQLDMLGIAASAGSACMSGTNERSHVLTALGIPKARPVVRFGFSKFLSASDIAFCAKKMATL